MLRGSTPLGGAILDSELEWQSTRLLSGEVRVRAPVDPPIPVARTIYTMRWIVIAALLMLTACHPRVRVVQQELPRTEDNGVPQYGVFIVVEEKVP